MKILIKKIIYDDPLFIIETTNFFNNYLDYRNILTRFTRKSLDKLFENFDFSICTNKTNLCKLINFLFVNRMTIRMPNEAY